MKIASTQAVVDNADLSGPKRDLVQRMAAGLKKRFLDQLQRRLSFLKTENFTISVSFGLFRPSELKVAGNIQVWLVPELDEKFAPGQVMTKMYKYGQAAADAANSDFQIDAGGPGRDPRTPLGVTPLDAADRKDPLTSKPVFVRLRESFVSRGGISTEVSEYERGMVEAAQARVDEMATTTLHELGHVFEIRKHTEGNFAPFDPHTSKENLRFRQSFPPRLMDTVSPRGQESSGARHDVIGTADIEQLGGWSRFVKLLEDPRVKRAELKGEEMHVWYDFSKVEFDDEQKTGILNILEHVRQARNNAVTK